VLVGWQALSHKGAQLLFGAVALADNKSARQVGALRVRHPHHPHLGHSFVLLEDGLDFGRRHLNKFFYIFFARYFLYGDPYEIHEVFEDKAESLSDVEIAFVIEKSGVASGQPAVLVDIGRDGVLGAHGQVALHCERRQNVNLTALVGAQALSGAYVKDLEVEFY
jgi:hypothetical protein